MVKRYQRGNQKPLIERQTIQWSKDTKGVIRSRKLKDRQYNGQMKRGKQTSNDVQNITQKIKD